MNIAEKLGNLISRINRIRSLVARRCDENEEREEWFNGLDNLLLELKNCLSEIQLFAPAADWFHPAEVDSENLIIVLREIESVLDGDLTFLGHEILRNVTIAYPSGRLATVVGNDEPITLLNCLLEELCRIKNIIEQSTLPTNNLYHHEEYFAHDDYITSNNDPVNTDVQTSDLTEDELPTPAGSIEEEDYQTLVLAKNQSIESKPNYNRIKGFLQDTGVLHQAYQKWIVLKSPRRSTRSIEEPFHKVLNVVQWWNPYEWEDADNVTKYLEALDYVISLTQAAGSSQGSSNIIHMRAKEVLEIARSRLKDLFCCLIDANAALHNSKYAAPPPLWFCSSTNSSSVTPYGGRDDSSGSYYTSSSASTLGQASAIELIDPETGVQQTNDETEEEYDGIIVERFVHMISQIVELASYFCQKKYDPSILMRPFNMAFEDVLKEKMASLGFPDMERDFNEMFVENWASTQRPMLSETRKKFAQAHSGVIRVIFPWQKCLCEEIFFHLHGFAEAFNTEESDLYVQQLLQMANAHHSDMQSKIDKFFQLIHVNEVLHDTCSNINIVYPDDSQDFVHGQVNTTLPKLRKAIIDALNDIQTQIIDDTNANPSFGKPQNINKDVGINELSCKVMRFIKKLSMYRRSPDAILVHNEVHENETRDEIKIAFGHYMLLLVSSLISNLEKKAGYILTNNNLPAAAQIFWINNRNYIVQELESVALGNLFEEVIQNQKNEIQQHLIVYVNSTCEAALSHLTNRSAIRRSPNRFESILTNTFIAQASWVVPDYALRIELRNSLSEQVFSAYTEFLRNNRFNRFNRSTIENLTDQISKLFEASH